MDNTGSVVIPAQYDRGYPFREGLAPVRTATGPYQYIDRTGKVVIETSTRLAAYPFTEGLAQFLSDSVPGVGFLDKQGAMAFTVPIDQYDEIKGFSDGLARVQKGSRWGYIDTKGHLVIPIKFYRAEDFNNGLARVDDYHYIDRAGKSVWPKNKN